MLASRSDMQHAPLCMLNTPIVLDSQHQHDSFGDRSSSEASLPPRSEVRINDVKPRITPIVRIGFSIFASRGLRRTGGNYATVLETVEAPSDRPLQLLECGSSDARPCRVAPLHLLRTQRGQLVLGLPYSAVGLAP